jgi:hypothetical protein
LAFCEARLIATSWMSNSFTLFGVVIHNSPTVGWDTFLLSSNVSTVTLEKPYSLAKLTTTWVSRNCWS